MNSLCKPVMKNLLCTNNVTHSGGYYGKTARTVVFTDTRTPGMNYIWITTAGQEYVEGQFYDITAECDGRGILKQVRMIKDYTKTPSKSEQPDEPRNPKKIVDVFDLIFDTNTK